MPLNRRDLRQAIRMKLFSWPIRVTALNGDHSAIATTINVDSASGIGQRMLIEIESETMFVISVSSNALTVIRGFMDTPAVTHNDNIVVNAYEPFGWTNNQVNLSINQAAYWLSKDPFPLWSHQYFTGTWPLNVYEADLGNSILGWPRGGGLVLNLSFLNDGSPAKYEYMTNFKQRQSIIQIARYFPANRSFRVELARFQPTLGAGDSATLDSVDYEEPCILRSCYWLLKDLQGNKAQAVEYSSALNERASTGDELLRTVFDFRNQADLAKRESYQPIPKELRRWNSGKII